MVREITDEMIEELKSVYESNQETLSEMENALEENGVLENGLTDLEETFEMGYNNALEHVFSTVGIDVN